MGWGTAVWERFHRKRKQFVISAKRKKRRNESVRKRLSDWTESQPSWTLTEQTLEWRSFRYVIWWKKRENHCLVQGCRERQEEGHYEYFWYRWCFIWVYRDSRAEEASSAGKSSSECVIYSNVACVRWYCRFVRWNDTKMRCDHASLCNQIKLILQLEEIDRIPFL